MYWHQRKHLIWLTWKPFLRDRSKKRCLGWLIVLNFPMSFLIQCTDSYLSLSQVFDNHSWKIIANNMCILTNIHYLYQNFLLPIIGTIKSSVSWIHLNSFWFKLYISFFFFLIIVLKWSHEKHYNNHNKLTTDLTTNYWLGCIIANPRFLWEHTVSLQRRKHLFYVQVFRI